LTISVGSWGDETAGVNLDLKRNGKEMFDIRLWARKAPTGTTETMARPMVVSLKRNNVINMYTKREEVYSDTNLQTALGGFLYNPRLNQPICWGVGYKQKWQVAGKSHLVFDAVKADVGGAWQPANSGAECPISGFYQVTFTAASHREPHTGLHASINTV
jgi:hypothetical protein